MEYGFKNFLALFYLIDFWFEMRFRICETFGIFLQIKDSEERI